MKLRCTKILAPSGKEASSSRWLIIGNEYIVLSMSVDSGGKVSVRLMGEAGPGPSIFLLQQFEIVDSGLSPTWVISLNPKGGFGLGPAAWSDVGFWERYFDGDPSATEIFEAERRKILAAD